MNADGSPGVNVDGRFAVVLPSAFTISMTVLGTGFALGLLGGLALILGLLAPRSATPPQPLVPAPARGESRPASATTSPTRERSER